MTRRAMTPARKRRIHTRENGCCYHCGLPVPMFGPEVRYDHVLTIFVLERDDDDDVRPAHTDCDKAKTAADQTMIAKIKRIVRKADPATRKPSRMRSAPFPKPSVKRPWPKRSFQGRAG